MRAVKLSLLVRKKRFLTMSSTSKTRKITVFGNCLIRPLKKPPKALMAPLGMCINGKGKKQEKANRPLRLHKRMNALAAILILLLDNQHKLIWLFRMRAQNELGSYGEFRVNRPSHLIF